MAQCREGGAVVSAEIIALAAIRHRARFSDTALVAAYMTDFPTVYVERPFRKFITNPVASGLARVCYRYCEMLYRRFDSVFALSENGGAAKLRSLGIDCDVVPLDASSSRGFRSPTSAPPGCATRSSMRPSRARRLIAKASQPY